MSDSLPPYTFEHELDLWDKGHAVPLDMLPPEKLDLYVWASMGLPFKAPLSAMDHPKLPKWIHTHSQYKTDGPSDPLFPQMPVWVVGSTLNEAYVKETVVRQGYMVGLTYTGDVSWASKEQNLGPNNWIATIKLMSLSGPGFYVSYMPLRKVFFSLEAAMSHLDLTIYGLPQDFHPSTNWKHCGKVIERLKISVGYLPPEHHPSNSENQPWVASKVGQPMIEAKTPQMAVCRAAVHDWLGNAVPVLKPLEELMKVIK